MNSREIMSEEKTGTDISISRSKIRRPDKQLYVPRARRKDVPSSRKDEENLQQSDSVKHNKKSNVKLATRQHPTRNIQLEKQCGISNSKEISEKNNCHDNDFECTDAKLKEKPEVTDSILCGKNGDEVIISKSNDEDESNKININELNRTSGASCKVSTEFLSTSSHQSQSSCEKQDVEMKRTGVFITNKVTNDENICSTAATPDLVDSDETNGMDENSWETLYNEDGECILPEVMNELRENFGKVKIQKPRINYLEFQPPEPVVDLNEFGHVIEIYDFPAEFKTQDLLLAFSQYRERGFDIKWVDDTHALGLFASPIAASEALLMRNTMLKTRPLSQASRESKLKARRCGEFLQPFKERPETSATLARRLVSGALGLQVRIPKEQREKERQLLKEAKGFLLKTKQ